MEETSVADNKTLRILRIRDSYWAALQSYRHRRGFSRISWITWIVTIVTVAIWCFTAYKVALAAGAHSPGEILANVFSNAENGDVLVAYGAKENTLILQGQYWRFVTPIFLHANLLHVGLNMLNFLILGIFIERIFGHTRFLLIYLLTGVISAIASFAFAPQDVSVGASGAIFGLVGAYSVFILLHRQALRRGGIPALLWIVVVLGVNLAIGFVIPNVDNFAHIGGLLSGCLLGWGFTPYYTYAVGKEGIQLRDTRRISRSWPLALLTILGTLLLAIIALHFSGG